MSLRPDVFTKPLTRDKLALIVGQRPELIRFMEALTDDVSDTLPTAIEELVQSTELVLASRTFTRSPALPAPTPSDDQAILAGQIFGA